MCFDAKRQEEILAKVARLIQAHKSGLLGGEKMPEDENPHLDKASKENYMYFTLPMALNYQRNSYVLWSVPIGCMQMKKPEVFLKAKQFALCQKRFYGNIW